MTFVPVALIDYFYTEAIMSTTNDSALPEFLSTEAESTRRLDFEDNASFIEHLTTFPLEALQYEPSMLYSASAQLTNALSTLCRIAPPTRPSSRCTAS